jgi:hypothetical protein
MKIYTYRYQLIRYVADLERREPINIGVILQDNLRTVFKINDHFQGDPRYPEPFNSESFAKWRLFFEEECLEGQITGQPDHGTIDFLHYLQSLCRSRYQLTDPLPFAINIADLDEACRYLYQRLALSPSECLSPSVACVRDADARPGQCFGCLGSWQGRLEQVNTSDGSVVYIYPLIGPTKIRCELKQGMGYRLDELLEKEVEVVGQLLFLDGDDFPYKILKPRFTAWAIRPISREGKSYAV